MRICTSRRAYRQFAAVAPNEKIAACHLALANLFLQPSGGDLQQMELTAALRRDVGHDRGWLRTCAAGEGSSGRVAPRQIEAGGAVWCQLVRFAERGLQQASRITLTESYRCNNPCGIIASGSNAPEKRIGIAAASPPPPAKQSR